MGCSGVPKLIKSYEKRGEINKADPNVEDKNSAFFLVSKYVNAHEDDCNMFTCQTTDCTDNTGHTSELTLRSALWCRTSEY